ncbi:MAG TPA: L,D-transpeptidase family protein [Pseudolabrys sp.]|nr:L,D-transpeptidase family protein [Pseudolabrys sp.]
MRSVRFDRLLAGTALGLVLALSGYAAHAQSVDAQINAASPVPEMPAPPTAKDFGLPEPVATVPAKAAETSSDSKAVAIPAETKHPETTATVPDATTTADHAVADQLRDLITGKLDRLVSRKADRAGIEAFYKARDYAPLWVTDNAANDRAKAATAYLAQVDTVGLNPSDYPAPDFKSAGSLADAELRLTESVLTYARHAEAGQINFTRVSGDIFYNLNVPDPAEVLKKVADSTDVRGTLDAFNPQQPEFKALRAKLAELRSSPAEAKPAEEKKATPQVHVGEGKILRPGMSDPRVIALRKRLAIAGDKNNPLYDDAVFNAVKAFQLEADIGSDGMLGPNTVRALNGEQHVARRPSANPIDVILVNMERWRWMPRELGSTHVVVNIPDYTLTLTHNNELYWKTKIVVGKPGKNTPLISAEMKFITINPTWNVPPSIIENEYLPALQEDPQALDRIGLKIYQDPDGTVHVFQPPGAANALGRIRFNFPNKFLVYQHDTPDKYLFARDKRAYSHGCMRVQDPFTYAQKLLSIELPNEHYTEAKIEKMLGPNEININFPKPIPVHLTYQTAFVDQDGKLQLREDIYGHDAKMIAILKNNSERRIADIAIERAPNNSAKPVKLPAGTYADINGGRAYGGGGPNFFDWLFGGRPGPDPYRGRTFIGPRARDNGRFSAR